MCPGRAANTAVLAEGARLLINDPDRFEGVRVIGVDEHVWRHTPYGDKYVTVILDLTPIREGSGPSRLLDMVPGRSKQVFKTWLATLWMSVVGAFSKNFTTGAGVPRIPCTRPAVCLHTRSCLLTPRQQHQLLNLFSGEEHVALEVTWSAYQNIIDAYRDPNKVRGKALVQAEINTLTSTRVPRSLTELMTLGRTLKRRAGDILAYFDHPHTSNGPTEAINGRLEHLRGSALGFAKPHQLHHPSTPRNRRIQTPTTPPIMKSRFVRRG